jgi:hypothetical protein
MVRQTAHLVKSVQGRASLSMPSSRLDLSKGRDGVAYSSCPLAGLRHHAVSTIMQDVFVAKGAMLCA